MKQILVDLIVWAWPVMPLRTKVWAFMNDGQPSFEITKEIRNKPEGE